MKVLIIEDEIHAAKSLAKALKNIETDIEIIEIIQSVEDSISYLSENINIDLIFMDIQLSDGISFEIFTEIQVDIPVVFTTSFDEYAIRAFEVNSIDYLLKPIDPKSLERALHKFHRISSDNIGKQDIASLLNQLNFKVKDYKMRFLVKTAKGLITVPVEEIAYFYIHNQIVFIKTFSGEQYVTDKTMDEVEKCIDLSKFFRLNRQFIAHFKSISQIHNFFNNTLKIELNPPIDKEIIISRYTIKEFKEWLDR